jgi:hypothetical protein
MNYLNVAIQLTFLGHAQALIRQALSYSVQVIPGLGDHGCLGFGRIDSWMDMDVDPPRRSIVEPNLSANGTSSGRICSYISEPSRGTRISL